MWITFLPFILVTIFVLAGFILLVKGIRGRYLTHAPQCRKCRYDLTGLTSDRCPECGSLVAEVGVITHHRQRYPGYILAGLVLWLPLIGAVILLGSRIEYYFDGYHYKPTAWVIDDAASGNPRLSQYAYRELGGRLRHGQVSDDHTKRLKQQVLAINPRNGWDQLDAAGDVVGELAVSGHLTPAEVTALLENSLSITMDARETSLRRYGIPVRVQCTGYLPWPIHLDEVLIKMTGPGDTTTIPARPPGQRPNSLHNNDVRSPDRLKQVAHQLREHGGAHSYDYDTTFRVDVPETGEYELPCAVRLDFVTGVPGPLIHTTVRRFTLTSNVVEEPPPGDIKLLTDPELGEKVRQAVTLQLGVPEPPLPGEPEEYVHFHLLFDRAPVAIAYNLITVVEGIDYAHDNSGYLVPQGRGVARAGPKAVPQPRPEKITYILRPDPALVYRTVDIDEIWGEPIEFRDLTVPPPATRTAPKP